MFTEHVSVTALPIDKYPDGKYKFDFFVHFGGRIIGFGDTTSLALKNARAKSIGNDEVIEAIAAFEYFLDTTNDENVQKALVAFDESFATV